MKFEESDEGKRVVDREGNVIGESRPFATAPAT
jgi:hypothetical protein